MLIKHGMTMRYCHTCNTNTNHLIVEATVANVKAYVCLRHTEMLLKEGAD